jgi:energy-converting hydrogenase Eha subunit C
MSSSCEELKNSTNPDYDINAIKGSGYPISEEREVEKFHSINFVTAGLVKLTQGSEQYLVVTVDDNLIEYISTRVFAGELIISVEPDVRIRDYELTIEIVMPDIESLITSSAGSIIGQNTIMAEDLSLVTNSAGNINLHVDVTYLNTTILIFMSKNISMQLLTAQVRFSTRGIR